MLFRSDNGRYWNDRSIKFLSSNSNEWEDSVFFLLLDHDEILHFSPPFRRDEIEKHYTFNDPLFDPRRKKKLIENHEL